MLLVGVLLFRTDADDWFDFLLAIQHDHYLLLLLFVLPLIRYIRLQLFLEPQFPLKLVHQLLGASAEVLRGDPLSLLYVEPFDEVKGFI